MTKMTRCKGMTLKKTRCSRKAVFGDYCTLHVSQSLDKKTSEEVKTDLSAEHARIKEEFSYSTSEPPHPGKSKMTIQQARKETTRAVNRAEKARELPPPSPGKKKRKFWRWGSFSLKKGDK